MSDNTENKIVETVVESTSNSNKALYLIGAGLFALVTYAGKKKL